MPVTDVNTPGGNYPVVVERGVLSHLRSYFPASHGKLFIVTEKRVWDAVGASIDDSDCHLLQLPGGESNKRLAPLESLAEEMVQAGADRTSIVIAVGGGIVTDMAGFLAAIFMRGIPVVQVPTTLLAQVDAAIGGKTGVNLVRGKNLIGSFHQPHAVLVDPAVLTTLPEREYRAGLYEVIKYGVISSPELYQCLQQQRAAILRREPEAVDHIIAACVRIKAFVVGADEREAGIRAILNFGHTVGHAIEAETGYTRYLHGEAVALGMKVASHLAHLHAGLTLADLHSILKLVDDYGPVPPAADLSPQTLYARLTQDKKTRQGHIHFILPSTIGVVKVHSDIPEHAVVEAIRQGLS